ncbi:MAG: SET domain-containing protein [bacterium]|nr:SET domain-containing protein [bacterium]
MLMVKTKIGPSTINGAGLGLFADQDIPKGTTTWRFMPGLDLIVPEDTLLQLSEAARAQFLNYCYVDKFTRHFVLCFDDERFINHSKQPNIVQTMAESELEGFEIATRDIKKGEELFCDYEHFDLDAYRKLNKLDIYAHMIEDEREREKEIENFIARLFRVNETAAKNGVDCLMDEKISKESWFGAKIVSKIISPFRKT